MNENNNAIVGLIASPNYSGITTQSFQGGTGITYQWAAQMEPGTLALLAGSGSSMPSTRKRIGPKLYFKYVKSKLNKVQLKKLKSRLTKLQKLINNASENGQNALYEELSRLLLVAVRESEAAACGHNVFVKQSDIDRFRFLVSENDQSNSSPVFFKKLEEFTRAVPASVGKVIKTIQAKKLFDELWVLYLDYTKDQIKSNKEKIREKDPILFGRFSNDPEKFYFLADWIDEHCDLTLNDFIEKMKEDEPEYATENIPEMNQEYLDKLKTEIEDRKARLNSTRPGNFRDNMDQEDELTKLRKENCKLRDDERFRNEDREVAVERAILEDRANRTKALELECEKLPPSPTKKRWWERLFE